MRIAPTVTTSAIRFAVHAHPGSKAPAVGGEHAGALVVHVRSRAVDGRANDEVVERLAIAFAVRSTDVSIVRGATSRSKFIQVNGDPSGLNDRLNDLLASKKSDP